MYLHFHKFKEHVAFKVISKHEKVRVDLSTRLNDLTKNRNKLFKIEEEAVSGMFAFNLNVSDLVTMSSKFMKKSVITINNI